MESSNQADRRGFLKRLAALAAGAAFVPALATPAQAGRSRWRGGYGGFGGYGGYGGGYGGYGGGYYRVRSGRRFYGGGYPVSPGYGGYGGYNPGYLGAPAYVPYSAPVAPYPAYRYYGPVMKRDRPTTMDALRLLEC